jgi:hypothetical protein
MPDQEVSVMSAVWRKQLVLYDAPAATSVWIATRSASVAITNGSATVPAPFSVAAPAAITPNAHTHITAKILLAKPLMLTRCVFIIYSLVIPSSDCHIQSLKIRFLSFHQASRIHDKCAEARTGQKKPVRVRLGLKTQKPA